MIDYLSLAIGHGLLALAMLRMVMRADLDTDPQIRELGEKAEAVRKASLAARRRDARTPKAAPVVSDLPRSNR